MVETGHVEVVAEIGINHQGSLELAIEMITVAAQCGADAVKFQKRRWQDYPDEVRWSNTFQKELPYREHKRLLEFDKDAYTEIANHCLDMGIDWFASVYDRESLKFIANFNPYRWKIASVVAATDLTLAVEVASQFGDCYLSLGMMGQWAEVDRVVEACATANSRLTLLHCVSEYPCPDNHVNLRMIQVLRDRYGLPVGYSGHDKGVPMSVTAVAMGAEVIEKHFTLDRTLPGSDHAASLEPHGLETLVRHIRAVESGIGDGVRRLTEGEAEKRRRFSK